VGAYKEQVYQLLQSGSPEDYHEKLDVFKLKWTEGFQTYYHKHLETAILSSYRPILETSQVYNELSGITNNPAESSNAAFKKVIEVRKASLFQAASYWYLYQNDKLFDTFRGFDGQGDFVLSTSRPADVYVPKRIVDVVDKHAIASVILDGKLPKHCRVREYKSVNLHEATSLRGIADAIVEKGGVKVTKRERGVFLVTGLLEKTYMV